MMDNLKMFTPWQRSSPRRRQRPILTIEPLEQRVVLSIGIAYVGLSKAPASEMTYLASQFKAETGEVEVSFLPFEFNPTNPFGNANKLAQETLPAIKGRLRLTVDLEWFVHSDGKNGKLDDGTGEAANILGRPAQKAFWAAWEADKPTTDQLKIRADFLARVNKTDVWVRDLRAWAASRGLGSKLGITFVPVLEDEFTSAKAYTNIVNAIKAQQTADGITNTLIRRSKSGYNSANFRITGVSMEWHGVWKDVKGSLKDGDTWSNDGTHYDLTANFDGSKYSINDFVRDANEARKLGGSALYWNADYNGTPKTDTNWTSRTVNPLSGTNASANRARLTQVLDIF